MVMSPKLMAPRHMARWNVVGRSSPSSDFSVFAFSASDFPSPPKASTNSSLAIFERPSTSRSWASSYSSSLVSSFRSLVWTITASSGQVYPSGPTGNPPDSASVVAGSIIWLLMNDSVLQAAGVAFLTVFLAELGDKSQLLALSLSARYRRPVLLAAVLTASALTIGAAVLVGDLIGGLLPTWVLRAGAGILFIVFSVLTLLREEEDDEGASTPARGGFLTAVIALC